MMLSTEADLVNTRQALGSLEPLICTRMALNDRGEVTGEILDISFVEPGHPFGVSPDRRELHYAGNITLVPPGTCIVCETEQPTDDLQPASRGARRCKDAEACLTRLRERTSTSRTLGVSHPGNASPPPAKP